MIAESPSTVSLRQVAAEAWARQQAEAAARRRQEIEEARERFVAEVRSVLRMAFTNTPHDPFSPFAEADVQAAELELLETADSEPFAATVTFAGERFRYHPTPHSRGDALSHVYTCPACGTEQHSTPIGSLADLGYWLEEAPKRCYHGEATS